MAVEGDDPLRLRSPSALFAWQAETDNSQRPAIDHLASLTLLDGKLGFNWSFEELYCCSCAGESTSVISDTVSVCMELIV